MSFIPTSTAIFIHPIHFEQWGNLTEPHPNRKDHRIHK
jgi:hypothetical protein